MKRVIKFIPIVSVLLCLTIMYIYETGARYTSKASSSVSQQVAKWAMVVNNVDVANGATSFGTVPLIIIDDNCVAPGMMAPGITAVASFFIDPTGVEVAFEYDVELEDIEGVPEALDIVVKVNGTEIEGISGIFSGIKLLPGDVAMTSADKLNITVEFIWDNNDINNANDTLIGLLAENLSLPVSVTVRQHLIEKEYYRGVEVAIAKKLFSEKTLNTNITVKNNNGIEYMVEDLEYNISMDNSKFDIIVNDISGGLIIGGSAKANIIPIVLNKKVGAIIDKTEEIEIEINVTYPFVETKIVTITYIDYVSSQLALHYDGINNTGTGHSNNPTVWKDLVGNNDGQLIGTTAWDDKGLTFNGTNTKVQFVGNINSTYTISIMVDPILTGQHPRLVGEDSGSNNFPAIYLYSSNGYRLAVYGHGKDSQFPGSNIPVAGEKTIVTMTYSMNAIKLYVNGVYISEVSSTSLPASSAKAYLGANSTTTRYLKGKIYNFLVYDRALTQEEIEHNVMVDRFRYGI